MIISALLRKRTKERTNRLLSIVSSVGIPLLIGAVLYYLICPDVFFVKQIDKLLVRSERHGPQLPSGILIVLIRSYFFDYLWAFAFTNALFFIFDNKLHHWLICMLLPVVLGAVMEYLQYYSLAKGTFDLWDIVAEFIGSLNGVLLSCFLRRKFK